MSEPRTAAGKRLLRRLVDIDGGHAQSELHNILAIEAEATSGGVTTEGLREALRLAEGRARDHDDLATAYIILTDAIHKALSTTPPAPDDFYVDTITDANGDELERGEPDPK